MPATAFLDSILIFGSKVVELKFCMHSIGVRAFVSRLTSITAIVFQKRAMAETWFTIVTIVACSLCVSCPFPTS